MPKACRKGWGVLALAGGGDRVPAGPDGKEEEGGNGQGVGLLWVAHGHEMAATRDVGDGCACVSMEDMWELGKGRWR